METKQKRKNPSLALTKAVLQKYNCRCQFCGNDDLNILELHHIDGKPENTTIDNLIPLCPNCHVKATKKIISQHDVEIMRQRVAVGTLPFPRIEKPKKRKKPQQNISTTHGGVSVVGDVSNSHIETHIHVDSKKSKSYIYPNSIGTHVTWINYIDYLINRLAEYRSNDTKYAGKNLYGAIRRIFKNKFGSNVKDVPEYRINDVINYFQNEINKTKFARLLIYKNYGKNFETYNEFCIKHGFIPEPFTQF